MKKDVKECRTIVVKKEKYYGYEKLFDIHIIIND